MRIAGAQIPVTRDIVANTKTIKESIDWASENNCDFLVTPEGSLSGYYPQAIMSAEANEGLMAVLSEIEEYSKNLKIGLCLGTLFHDLEEIGYVKRNQIRFYDKEGTFLGATNKTYLIKGWDGNFLAHDLKKAGIKVIKLETEKEQFNAVGLICNDLWGSIWESEVSLPWAAYGTFNLGRESINTVDKTTLSNKVHLFIHSTNGGRGNKDDELYNDWHDAHLRMMSFMTKIPIITVDNCNLMTGEATNCPTSSESGVIINSKWHTKVPRVGKQYFYFDFTTEYIESCYEDEPDHQGLTYKPYSR